MAHRPLPLTGERTAPGIASENYWFQRHVAAYRFAATRCRCRHVLDAGCGEGYGSRLLAAHAATVLGVDVAADVIAHAASAYPRGVHPGVEFRHADLCQLPLSRSSVDIVVCLQVIEHIADVDGFLSEVSRVLRPGGEFVCATPNRLTFSPDRAAPRNPFHVREYAPVELVAALGERFRLKALLGVHHASWIRALEATARRPLPELLLASPAEEWPGWLRAAVARVRSDDFRLRADRIIDRLDLLAIASKPRAR
jgi:SAM-dependent methyltransferase